MTFVATYASAGEGHRRAAEALAQAPQGDTVELRDCLIGSAAWFRWTYTEGYLRLVRSFPMVWGGLYAATDRWGGCLWLRSLRRWGNARQGRALEEWLVAAQPSALITTHFFPVEVACALKRTGQLRSKILCVITDWLPHTFWICPEVDHYAVAAEATREMLIHRGVPTDRVTVTGIPIRRAFAEPLDRAEAARRLGIDPERFTLLIGSGGFGVGPLQGLASALAQARGPYQLLVVAGRNLALQKTLEAVRRRIPHPMKVYGFIQNMESLMAASDLLISKTGGLTCAEAMAKGLPMIAVAPIPGQETRNATVLIKEGAAIRLRRLQDLPRWIEELRHPERLEPLRAAARRLGRPHAAEAVLKIAQGLAHA